jgi:hypothetical protein
VVERQGLDVEHVECGSGYRSRRERGNERSLVDDRAA